jgi:hypothetical protein
MRLPCPSAFFDRVFAFDIIEHLVGGKSWQRSFLKEVSRVLSPEGMVFLTTPNFWHPYDAHTELYVPQFLPSPIADRYIARFNPGFLQEHGSFKNIRLVTPRFLKRIVGQAGLAPLHELPCCLDLKEFATLHRWRGLLARAGLGWYPHAEFWMVLAHRSARDRLRAKLKKNWRYEHSQPSPASVDSFSDRIDFDLGPFGSQLRSGWHWHENEKRGFRWMEKEASCFLEASGANLFLRLEAFSPIENRLSLFCEGLLVGEHVCSPGEMMVLKYLLPFNLAFTHLYEIQLRLRNLAPSAQGDSRKLGMMVFNLEISR